MYSAGYRSTHSPRAAHAAPAPAPLLWAAVIVLGCIGSFFIGV
jgi:hypothetical protein